MDAAIDRALDRHGLSVESCGAATVVETVLAAAPDLVLLVGDAAVNGGADVLHLLASNPATSVVPVAVLSDDISLDSRLSAFRHGAVALIPRGASSDAIARRTAEIARELPERSGEASGELGEATLDELLELVRRELRSGILSVEGKDETTPAMRLVLGAGKPVSEALSDFVKRLRPLIAKAEPLRYELIEESAGRIQLLDPEDTTEGADLQLLAGLRVLVVDDDPARADALAQELRARHATVAVTDASGRGLDRARALDPEVVILDASGLEGPGFEVVRTLRRDPRFRWAQLLVASWDEIWPNREGPPDMHRLAGRIAPLVEQDRALRARAGDDAHFDTRLEITGPSRTLRALASAPKPLHVTVRNPKALIEIDVTEGLVVGATGMVTGRQDPVEGSEALAAFLVLSSGRVRVERRANPSTANIMAPVDEALAAASAETPPIRPSIPPGTPSEPAARVVPAPRPVASPFPSASDLETQPAEPATGAEQGEDEPEPTGTGPLLAPPEHASTREGGDSVGPSDLSWSDDSTAREVPPSEPATAKPAARATPASPAAPARRPKARTMVGYAPPATKGAQGSPGEGAPAVSSTAKKKTMLGVAPPKPAAMPTKAARLPGATEVRSPTDDAPTIAPPPVDREAMKNAMNEALDQDTELEAVPAGARPAAKDEPPAPASGERDDPTTRVDAPPTLEEPVAQVHDGEPVQVSDPALAADGRADAMAFADTMQPGAMAAPVAPPVVSPEAAPAADGPAAGGPAAVHVPAQRRRAGGGKAIAIVVGVLALLGVAAAAAVFLVPSLRARVLGEPEPIAGGDVVPTTVGEPEPVAEEPSEPVAEEPSEPVAEEPTEPVAEEPSEQPVAEEPSEQPVAEEPSEEPVAEEPSEEPVAEEPSEADRLAHMSADELVHHGNDALHAGELDEAEQAYRIALDKEERNNHAMAGLASVYVRRGEAEPAVEWAEKAVHLRRRRMPYRVILGDAYALAGRVDDARQEYRRVLREEPDNPLARQGLERLGE